MQQLPPGQSITRKFPVVGEKAPPPEALDLAHWRLELGGQITSPVSLTYDAVMKVAQDEFTADIHCVTSWSQPAMHFTGIRLSDLLAQFAIAPLENAQFVRFEAYSHRLHDTSLPLELAISDSWLVHSFEGKPLTPSRGYPLRIVTPSRYFYKSLKWLRRITFLESDRLGFWERTSGYHNNGDPWREERLDGTRFTSQSETNAFRNLTDFSDWRQRTQEDAPRVLVKANLQHWRPRTPDLTTLQLKACDFRGAELDGVNFSEANLTLGTFTGASLRNAMFESTDLEGADFSGADLTGAHFSNNFLSATTFIRDDRPLLGFDGMTMTAPDGLLEDQRAYLEALEGVFLQLESPY
ncbi:MAG: molybdopterin-dependent oxidoreductase [Verrucomicrobia bacterium]|nr:molybdopterin-dependent oxidoreductase [Verrucomicrobiota bacterium]